jgi:hypothetical protein
MAAQQKCRKTNPKNNFLLEEASVSGIKLGLLPRKAAWTVFAFCMLSPCAQSFNHGSQGPTSEGERVLHPGRLFGIYLASDNSVAFQFPELLGQHFLRGVRQQPAQFSVTLWASHQVVENDGFPLAADHIERGANWTIFETHGIRTGTK